MGRWFRHYAGMCADPKFGGVARRAKVGRDRVVFVFAFILESASERNNGGSYDWDADAIADLLNCETDEITRVHGELEASGIVGEGRIASWARIKGPDWSLRPPPADWEWLRLQTFERDDYTCTYCGAHGGRLECDHITPVSRGGSNEPENLTTACFACNRSKGAKMIAEWVR
tara:strand:+ start:43 stop:561 length:519 start_codon:yes stop_codon:yes gene_type:complete